jgi:type II restriction/modification system DNA methylase subunit YeeA
MHIRDFIKKWQASKLKERAASQEHFLDLCRLLGQQTPGEADPEGIWYTFEKGAYKSPTDAKTSGQESGKGFADVWRKGHFAWEYKGKNGNLEKAYAQLLRYRAALENPPLLIVSDMDEIEIHTNFTNTPEQVHSINLQNIDQPENLQKLKWIFTNPENFKPGQTIEQITTQAAEQFARLAQTLRSRGHHADTVAHFLSKLIFCLFAEDAGLLPKSILTQLIESAGKDIELFNEMLAELLLKMNQGGRFGVQRIAWFNGGLFNDDAYVPLIASDIVILSACSRLDWSQIEPSILGTLFERGLDPAKRSQLGAHYTPRSDMERVVDPVLTDPLRAELANLLGQQARSLEKAEASGNKASLTKARKQARTQLNEWLERLRQIRVLDPACGSGNFLFVALERLHSLEKEALYRLADLEGGQMSLDIQVGPHQVLGLELNPYAAELARVTVWIGHLQWMIQNGFGYAEDPILQPLDHIRQQDAILDLSGAEPAIPAWPEADIIVGNPPFLGGSKLRSAFGASYYENLRKLYEHVLSGGADLVAYWLERARQQIEAGKTRRVGFISTQAIRTAANQNVLKRIKASGNIFWAESDRPWILDGADVRVSMVAFDDGTQKHFILDGETVDEIQADLTSTSMNLTTAVILPENKHVAFVGSQKIGPFEIPYETALDMLNAFGNPNGRPNSDVLKPSINGSDLMGKHRNMWIIDFGVNISEEDASLYELPFEYISVHVKPERLKNRRISYVKKWWQHGEARPAMRVAITGLSRFIVSSRVSKHRVFSWLHSSFLPDNKLCVIAREDDVFFGVLHSHMHEVWSLHMGARHGIGNDPVYNVGSCFETFPFPPGLTPNLAPADYSNPHAEAIATAARRLCELRDNWLNPPELIQRVPEVLPGYPDRLLPKDEAAAKELKKRTLTNLYNARPAWLAKAHAQLDAAVAAAYGWPADLSDDEVLRHLLTLNQERSKV